MTRVTLGEPVIQDRGSLTRWTVPALADDGVFPGSIWFEVPSEYAHMLTHLADPAVIALVIPAQRAGYDVTFAGPVTDQLAFQHAELQALYAECGYGVPRSVEFGTTVSARGRGGDVLAGFSAGVDSYAMIGEYLSDSTPESLRLTHLLFNNVGSHSGRGEELWRARYRRLVPVTHRLDLPFIPVNSNLDQLPGSSDYQVVNSPANAAVAHLLGASAGAWVFSSSVEYRRVRASKDAYNSAFVDPLAMPLMSTTGLSLRLSRSDLRRVDKAKLVAEVPEAWASLDVCVDEGTEAGIPNCSHCWKCQMTLAAFDLLGVVDRFGQVFDLALWRRDRQRYLARAYYTRKPALVAELAELMDEVGYEVPRRLKGQGLAQVTWARAVGRSAPARSRLKRVLLRDAVRR